MVNSKMHPSVWLRPPKVTGLFEIPDHRVTTVKSRWPSLGRGNA